MIERLLARMNPLLVADRLPGGLLARAERLAAYAALRGALDRMRIGCVLDVGANRGQFASLLRRLGYRGPIVSFDPNPAAFAVLQATFGADPAWRGFPYALGAAHDRLVLHVPETSEYGSLLGLERSGQAELHAVETDVRRLDAVFDEVTRGLAAERFFLKTDTQGYDVEVLRGAAGCLERVWGLLAELSVVPLYDGAPRYTDALAYYESLGFALLHLSVVKHNERDGTVMEYDGLFVRPS